MQTDTKSKTVIKNDGYSKEYKTIRSAAETSWPEWKKTTYNLNFATSANAKKITSR